jgi:hypothetical protein
MAEDPSFALVDLDETVTSLRWNTAKLQNPFGRFFGGKHSSLVVTFSSGSRLRIEKLGLGEIVYCPTIDRPKCNMNSGDKYKFASGKYLKPTTWTELHGLMVNDAEHYDVVDDNCHHAVQRVWNGVVVDKARDTSPAPDNYLLIQWSGFLRWWSGSEPKPTDEEDDDPTARALSVRRWQGWPDDQDKPHYDAANVRRRRRRAKMGDRCRASKPAGWNNENAPACPMRESSWSDGKSMSCDFESCGSKLIHFWSSKSARKDSDSSGSDCKFGRMVLSGGESDCSGSSHYRYKSSASTQSESSFSDESHEIMPMDPRRDMFYGASAPGGDCADSCSLSASEIGWSYAGRSKGNLDGMCGPDELDKDLGSGASWAGNGGTFKAEGTDMLCEWRCTNADHTILYLEDSESEFICEATFTPDAAVQKIALTKGNNLLDCAAQCGQGHKCQQKCIDQCTWITSSGLNSGGATCVDAAFSNPSSGNTTFTVEKKQYSFDKELSGGAIALICFCVICQCCQCCAPFCKGKRNNQVGNDLN